MDASTKVSAKDYRFTLGIVSLLVAVTMAAYSVVLSNDFIYYDDNTYVTENNHVRQGLSWEGVKWAFTTTYANNWHPLTWLSHMLDVQLFGLDPAGHHFTNLLFHIIATLLLFGFLQYATGMPGLSTFVAALFALHPMHVESVAWISERKDVLSAVFWFATMWAYVYYVKRPSIRRYILVFIVFALGLMAKPMLVSLPIILLLLDYWPLERLSINRRSFSRLLLDKIPLLTLSAGSAVITVLAQNEAVARLDKLRFAPRIFNAIVSYCIYLGQVFWPTKLTIFYPYSRARFDFKTVICGILLVMLTTAVLCFGRKKKYLITGWLWFIITLIPVIGIVQVGSQAHADRYTYLPFIGIYIVVVWGLHSLILKIQGNNNLPVKSVTIVAIVILLVFLVKTRQQVGLWKNDYTLFSHALKVTKRNYIAYNHLGFFFEKTGQTDDALKFYLKALEINEYGDAHYNAANMLLRSGQVDKAITHYRRALEINPSKIKTLSNLAGAYVQNGQFAEAIPLMQRALTLAKAQGDEALIKDAENNIELLKKAIDSSEKNTEQ